LIQNRQSAVFSTPPQLVQLNSGMLNPFAGLLPTEWVKTGGFCEFVPILKGFSLTWQSLANGMLGDAKINQDKTPAG
jgi:hypothetical protein